jgi:tetratricopeptide (TPR) repeat protein
MTFSHGDYARIDAIKEKDDFAERLYRRALAYAHDHRAYLGLGIIKQKREEYEESIRLLNEAIQYFPNSEPLHLCLGISYLNIGVFEKALSCFLVFQDSKDAMHYIAACYRALGDFEKESVFLKRLEANST